MPYTKTVWSAGDVIDAVGLNNLEDGLEAVTGEVDNDRLPTAGGTMTGELVMDDAQVRVSPGSDLAASGTLTLDFSGAGFVSAAVLTGNVAFASTNLAAGRSVTVRVLNGANVRTVAFPAGWTFVGVKPTTIDSSKVGVLTVTAFGGTDASVVAAWAVQT